MTGKMQIETVITDLAARIGPLTAPLPTAYAVATATGEHLGWPVWVSAAAAVSIEVMGIATVNTALELREYNASKRKSDPSAPFALAVGLTGGYLGIAVGLAVVMDVAPALAVYAPAIFPLLSLAGATVLSLRADHRRRLDAIEQEKGERRAARASKRASSKASKTVQQSVQEPSSTVQEPSSTVQETVQDVSSTGRLAVQDLSNTVLDAVNVSKRERKAAVLDAMLDIYVDSPEAGATAVAGQLGIGRSTVYNYLDDLEQAGKVKRNGNGVRVLA